MVLSTRAQLHIKDTIRKKSRTLNNIVCALPQIIEDLNVKIITKYPVKKNIYFNLLHIQTDHRNTSTDSFDSQHWTIPILLTPLIPCHN